MNKSPMLSASDRGWDIGWGLLAMIAVGCLFYVVTLALLPEERMDTDGLDEPPTVEQAPE